MCFQIRKPGKVQKYIVPIIRSANNHGHCYSYNLAILILDFKLCRPMSGVTHIAQNHHFLKFITEEECSNFKIGFGYNSKSTI